jgi:hypothetical protein
VIWGVNLVFTASKAIEKKKIIKIILVDFRFGNSPHLTWGCFLFKSLWNKERERKKKEFEDLDLKVEENGIVFYDSESVRNQ